MVAYFNVFGRQVGSHYLALGCLTTYFAGPMIYLKTRPSKAVQTPPINAASADEESFVKQFMAEAEAGSKH